MRLSLIPIFFLGAALSASVFGCEGETSPEGDGDGDDSAGVYECYDSGECQPGEECSGGSCVSIVACTSDDECSGAQTCSAGACRSTCTGDTDCGSLVCDVAQGLCMPAPNPQAGSGGNGSGGSGISGTGGSGSGGSSNPEEPTYSMIDDFQDGDIQILPTDDRIGYWYTYNEQAPRPLADSPLLVDGSNVIHASGSHQDGVSADAAYGGLGVDLNNENNDNQQPRSSDREPYDASEWDGFRFRIKSAGGTKSIRFEVVTVGVASSEEGGTCSGSCFDAHGRDVALTTEWTTVKVPFDTLVQEGWGNETAFDAAQILGLAWEDLTTASWEFWLDDLEFYKDAPGTDGPVVTPGMCGDSWGDEPNGSITWYTFDQGTDAFGDVNCSYGITVGPGGNGDKVNDVYTGGGTYFGAIATADYDQAAACGACVEVTRDGGASVVVTVVDQCPIGSNPKCVKGHIDLSKAAFLQLGQESEGYIGQRAGLGSITWKYVDCPVPEDETVSFRLKENNPNWNMVIVENHKYPIASVQVNVNGEWLNASREEYNFWLPPGGRFGAGYEVRAVDINGGIVTGTASLAGTSSGEQFTCE